MDKLGLGNSTSSAFRFKAAIYFSSLTVELTGCSHGEHIPSARLSDCGYCLLWGYQSVSYKLSHLASVRESILQTGSYRISHISFGRSENIRVAVRYCPGLGCFHILSFMVDYAFLHCYKYVLNFPCPSHDSRQCFSHEGLHSYSRRLLIEENNENK